MQQANEEVLEIIRLNLEAKLLEWKKDGFPDADLRVLARHVYYQAVQLTERPPSAILRGVKHANGLEG